MKKGMKIVLYETHHILPFCSGPKQPKVLFEPEIMESFLYHEKARHRSFLAKDHWTWPMLMGLHNIGNNMMLAHVSLFLEDGILYPTEQIYVGISAAPTSHTPDGIPLVFDGKRVRVDMLWHTNSPLKESLINGSADKILAWEEYFRENLWATKEKLHQETLSNLKKLECFGISLI